MERRPTPTICFATLILLWFANWGAACPAAEPPPSQTTSLIRDLGDASFATREKATQDLIALGFAAIDQVEAAADSHDREVRLRAKRIAAVIRQAEFESRLTRFAAQANEAGDGNEENRGEPLPGWKRYRELIGDDADAKGLFVEMQRVAGELLAAAHADPQSEANLAAHRLLSSRLRELNLAMQDSEQDLPRALIAACLWASADERIALNEEECGMLFALGHQESVKSAFANSADGANGQENRVDSQAANPALRRLLGAVIRRADGPAVFPAIALAMNLSLPDGLAPAERLIRSGSGRAQQLQFAIFTIARFGHGEHVALLESQFSNTARVASHRVDDIEYVAEIRDLALAAAWHLSGADPRQHGFTQLQSQQTTVFSPASLGFAGESARQAAFAAWQAHK